MLEEADETELERDIYSEDRKEARDKNLPQLISYNQELISLQAIRDILSDIDETSLGEKTIENGDYVGQAEARKAFDAARLKIERLSAEFKLKYGDLSSAQIRKNSFAKTLLKKIDEQKEIMKKMLPYISYEDLSQGNILD